MYYKNSVENGKNVYIGSRYVPMVMGEWDKTKTYEPLSIVLVAGNSYTSKQNVPVGAEITDTNFWVQTGNYNGQISSIQQQVDLFKTNMENGFTQLDEKIDNTATSITENFNAEILNINTELTTTNKKIDNVNIGVSVKQFGAKGDGLQDDTEYIQNALNSEDRKTVYFPDGVYIVSEPLKTRADNRTVSIILSKNATVKAKNTFIGGAIFELGLLGGSVEGFISPTDNPCIIGGIIDCNSVTGGISITDLTNVEISTKIVGIGNGFIGINFKPVTSPLKTTISTDGFVHDTLIYGSSSDYDTTGIETSRYDNNFSDIKIVGCKVGVYLKMGGSLLNNVHCTWVGNTETLTQYQNGVAFMLDNSSAVFTNCYADTYAKCWNWKNGEYPVIMSNCRAYWYTHKSGVENKVFAYDDVAGNTPWLKCTDFVLSLQGGSQNRILSGPYGNLGGIVYKKHIQFINMVVENPDMLSDGQLAKIAGINNIKFSSPYYPDTIVSGTKWVKFGTIRMYNNEPYMATISNYDNFEIELCVILDTNVTLFKNTKFLQNTFENSSIVFYNKRIIDGQTYCDMAVQFNGGIIAPRIEDRGISNTSTVCESAGYLFGNNENNVGFTPNGVFMTVPLQN